MTLKAFCPACQTPLVAPQDDGPCHCSGCGGTWLPTLAAASFDSIEYDVVTGEVAEHFGVPAKCPSCSSGLKRRLLSSVGVVEACDGCGSLYLGPGKYNRLQKVLAGEDQSPPLHLASPESPSGLWRAVMMLSALSAAAAWLLTARVL